MPSDDLVVFVDEPDGSECSLDCSHGEIVCFDRGPLWSDDQLIDFARAALSARASCACFGEHVWLPATPPEHVEVRQLRLYETNQPDPAIDTERPRAMPGAAVSLAAHRIFESRVPDDHPLDQDWALVRWWWRQRQLGLLDDD